MEKNDHAVFEVLIKLEQSLHSPQLRQNKSQLEQLLASNYFEIGSSGNLWIRDEVINRLVIEENINISAHDFKVKKISDEVMLVTYKTTIESTDGTLKAYRSSIWQKNAMNEQWQMLFHQGTRTSN